MNYNGTTLLRAIVGRSKQNLSLVMAMIPSHLRLPVIAAQDTYPMMVGLDAEVILKFLSGDERIQFVTATDAAGNSYLHTCERMMYESEHLLTGLLPKETLVSTLLAQNFEGNTPLHKLYDIKTVIPNLEHLMTPFQVDQLFSLRNSDGNTILHGMNPQEVLIVLAKLKLPSNSFLGIQNRQGQTILHQTVDISYSTQFYRSEPAGNSLLVAKILSFVNVAKRASIIMLKDLKSNTILHMIDYKLPEAIISVLNSVPYKERDELLRIQDQGGQTPIHLIVSMAYHHTLLQVMRLFSATQIVQLLSCQDNNGSTPLHIAAASHKASPVCQVILRQVTSSDIPNLLRLRNKRGDTAVHTAAAQENTHTLNMITSSTSFQEMVKILSLDASCPQLEMALTSDDDDTLLTALANLDFYNRCLLLDILNGDEKTRVKPLVDILNARELQQLETQIAESSLRQLNLGKKR